MHTFLSIFAHRERQKALAMHYLKVTFMVKLDSPHHNVVEQRAWPSAHGTWLKFYAVYLYMCIIIPSSFQAWLNNSHLLSLITAQKPSPNASGTRKPKKGSVTVSVVLMRNSCFTWHFPILIPWIIQENPKRKVRSRKQHSYYACSLEQKLLFGTDDKRKAIFSAHTHLHSNDCQGQPVQQSETISASESTRQYYKGKESTLSRSFSCFACSQRFFEWLMSWKSRQIFYIYTRAGARVHLPAKGMI